jgi:hypothetical protein
VFGFLKTVLEIVTAVVPKLMSVEEALEYAILAQQCYYLESGDVVLPENWRALFHWSPSGGWDNLYAMCVNESRKEVVLAIRGTDNLFNMLSDTSLIAGAFTGNFQVPPGQQDIQVLANSIHYHLSHEFIDKNSDAVNNIEAIGRAIQEFERQMSPQISNWILALLYIAAITAGLYTINQVIPLPLVSQLAMGAVLAGTSYVSLKTVGQSVTDRLLMILGNKTPSSMAALKSATLAAIENNFSGYTLKIVGHSLGAVMAELCAVEIGVQCISFESPGSLEIIKKFDRYRISLDNGLRITNYLSAPNIINTLNEYPGVSYRMFLPHTNGKFSLIHGTNCLLQSGSRVATYVTLGAFTWGKILVQKGVETAAFRVSGSAFAGAIGTKLVGGVAGLWKDLNWLRRQHKIDNIVAYLRGGGGSSAQLREAISWPRVLFHSRVLHNTIDFVWSTVLPLQKDLPGIRNLKDEEGMREEQINRINGYEVVA